MDTHSLSQLSEVARADRPADLLFRNARLVDVFTGTIRQTDIAVASGCIVGLGDYQAERTIDLGGSYVAPGFIDALGATDEDLLQAVGRVKEMGGGLTAVSKGQVLASLPLPIAGLMSDQPMTKVRQGMDQLLFVARQLGSTLSDPFMTLSFLALPVIPSLKLTDQGLVDVERFCFVPLFE